MVAAEFEEKEKNASPMRRRVLFVSPETTPSDAPIQLAHLIGWLKAHGWEPSVIASEDGPVAAKFRAHGIEPLFEPRLLIDPAWTALRALIPQFDVVVANTITTGEAVQVAKLEDVPVVWYLHENLTARHFIEQNAALRSALASADALVTPTQAIADIYQPFTERPIHVVSYGLPEVKLTAPAGGGPFTFVTLGPYAEGKGQDILVEAIRELHPDLRWRASFQMAGRTVDKPFHHRLRARSESIYNVQLLGPLTDERSLALLNQAHVMVCPSRDGAMPMVLLEAMSLGKAVICTNLGGVSKWLRDKTNALLVPAEDPRVLAVALARCICDRDLVRALGAAARKTFVEHFDLDRLGEEFAAILEQTSGDARKSAPPAANYAEWVELYETLGPADRQAIRRQLESLVEPPLISILLPVYNPDLKLLSVAIDSVRQQIYDRWELCIADHASTDVQVRPFLQKAAASEARILLALRGANGQTAACANAALALATGEWCAVLDQADALPEHALAKVALEIAENPDAGLLYADEDEIDFVEVRSQPLFKTDWNRELFLGQNYINHSATYRTSMLRAIGGFREGLGGSQDYDLTLRYIERLQAHQIRHIPRILYHSRVAGNAADEREAKPYVREAARRAIADHLQRVGIAARVEPCPENPASHRVIYETPDLAPRVGIVVAARSSRRHLQECVKSIRAITDYPSYEVIVACGSATDVPEGEIAVVRTDDSENPGRLNNLGAAAAGADILLFLDSGVEVTESDWLRELVSQANRTDVGVVGARLWYADGTLQHSGFILGLDGIAGIAHHRVSRSEAGSFDRTCLQRNCSAVSLACMGMRTAVFHEIGGFDEKNLMSNFQDIDFCLRLREHGLEVVWTPYANLVHHGALAEGKTSEPPAVLQPDTQYMQERWREELREDPFYSPNLSLAEPGFELAFPPRWFAAEE